MGFDIWNIYRRLPEFLQALVAALLAFFLNISVAVILILIASDTISSANEQYDSREKNVLGVSIKRDSPVVELVKNILYIAGDVLTEQKE